MIYEDGDFTDQNAIWYIKVRFSLSFWFVNLQHSSWFNKGWPGRGLQMTQRLSTNQSPKAQSNYSPPKSYRDQ